MRLNNVTGGEEEVAGFALNYSIEIKIKDYAITTEGHVHLFYQLKIYATK